MILKNVLLIGGAMLGFAVVHSLTAGIQPKVVLQRFFDERFIEGWYRLFYNVFSVVTFIPVVALYLLLPDRVLFTAGSPWPIVLIVVRSVGILGLIGALFATDVWRFIGLRQAMAYLNGVKLPLDNEPFQVKGMYALVRHPLYFFSLLFFWAAPSLSYNDLIFNGFVTAYFLIGSLVEENRLERIYGEEYRKYKKQVPWIIPVSLFQGRGSGSL